MRSKLGMLLLLSAVASGILLPAVGYCELCVRNTGSLRVELDVCGERPNLDDARWVVSASLVHAAAVLLVPSVALLLLGVRTRARGER